MGNFDAWLDRVANGGGVSADEFAKDAIGTVPRVETPVHLPSRKDVWPPEVWADMQRIARGEA